MYTLCVVANLEQHVEKTKVAFQSQGQPFEQKDVEHLYSINYNNKQTNK